MENWKADLVRMLGQLLAAVVQPDYSRAQASKRLVTLSKRVNKPAQPSLITSDEKKKESNEITEVFLHWQEKTKRATAKLTPQRRSFIKSRIGDGFTVLELKRVIDAAATSPFHQGENERGKRYDWIENIMRSTEQVERTLERIGAKEPEPSEKKSALELKAEQALADGDISLYNMLQERMRDVS